MLVAPLLLCAVGVLVGWFLPGVAAPRVSVALLTGVVMATALGLGAGLLLMVAVAVADVPGLGHWLGWCQALYPQDPVFARIIGLAAVGVLVVGAVRVVRFGRRVRAESAPWAGAAPLEVISTDEPVAFAVPGKPGSVVVGSGLLGSLPSDERSALLAHERAHLDHGHHRYLRVAGLCAAAFPVLAPLTARVRYSTERWADESAAAEVGDRKVVARAIARVALMSHDRVSPSMAFTGRGTAGRVSALLDGPPMHRIEVPVVLAVAAAVGATAGSSVQLHHLVTFVAQMCHT